MPGSGLTKARRLLTAQTITGLKAETAPYRVSDTRTPGLAIRVAPAGGKTWDLTYRIKGVGSVKRLSLGSVEDIGLADARDRADAITRAARQGHDLVAAEAAARLAVENAVTVHQLILEYVKRRVTGKLRTAKEIEARLNRALAEFLHKPAAELKRRDLRQAFDNVHDGGTPREAEKRRQTVGAMFRWALSQDYVENDPTAGLSSYGNGLPKDRAFDFDEIRKLWIWIKDGHVPPRIGEVMKLQLLTGARCGEVAGMRACEIDTERWHWWLPAERSKNKKPRLTPLVGLAREIIKVRISHADDVLFPSQVGKPLAATNIGNALADRAQQLPIHWFTSHDLRRTFATRLVEMDFSHETVAAILGHEVGDKNTRVLRRHYVRTPMSLQKLKALEAWDNQMSAVLSGATDNNVVAMSA